MQRQSKLCSLESSVDGLTHGQTVIVGGSMFHNKPMAIIREIVRRKIRDLTVVAVPQASIDVDLLIAAGCVAEVRVPYLGFEYLGMAMGFRRESAKGKLRVWNCDETQLLAALEATAKDLPSGLAKSGVGTDLPKLNPDLKEIDDPVTGEPVLAVPALAPDFAFLHATYGDMYGNLRYAGYPFGDLLIAEATRRGGGCIVASVDELTPLSLTERDPLRTEVSAMLVDRVVHAPYGAHPCSSHGYYTYDEEELAAYVSAARADEATTAEHIKQRVFDAPDHLDYLDRVLRPSKIVNLRNAIYV